jgi:PAS domain-containing protein
MLKRIVDIRSLPVQMISAFVALVILATVTVGVPSITMLQRQLDHQAWSQLEQGQRAATALYGAQMRELKNLVTLTAQRPTLHQLLDQQDPIALLDYLYTLQKGAGVDWIEICSASQTIVTTVTYLDICESGLLEGYYPYADHQLEETWMFARTSIDDPNVPEDVILGFRLDDAFSSEMHDQTGLEHTICMNGKPVATSFQGGIAALVSLPYCEAEGDDISMASQILGGRPYYIAHIPLGDSDAKDTVALDVSEIATTKSQMILWMLIAILGISFAGTILGVLFSRRLSQPLVQLSDTAEKFSQGDLETPVAIDTQVREVAQVARALEGARGDLLSTLTTLQSERNWGEHLLESIVEGIMILDDQWRITFFSRGAERITGWQREEVIGHSCNDVFHLAGSDQPFNQKIPELGGRGKADVLLSNDKEASLAITGAELTPSGTT